MNDEGQDWTSERAPFIALWRNFAQHSPQAADRADYQFDPGVYLRNDPTLAARWPDLKLHYASVGRKKGWKPNRYQIARISDPGIDDVIEGLVTLPELRNLLAIDREEALELAYELMALGPSVDEFVSRFSARVYGEMYGDVRTSGLDPFDHYIRTGAAEGRRLLGDLQANMREGQQEFDPQKRTCVICCGDLRRIARGVVRTDMLLGLSAAYNVIVAAAREDSHTAEIEALVHRIVITPTPEHDLRHLVPLHDHPQGMFGIVIDTGAAMFANTLVQLHIPFAALITERLSQGGTSGDTYCLALYARVLAFTSQPIRESWVHFLADLNVSADSCVLLRPISALYMSERDTPRRSLGVERAETRKLLETLIDQPLDNRLVIYGSGNVSWRAGTDLFAMAATIARKTHPDLLFVWQGDGPNQDDKNVGMWMRHHIDAATDPTSPEPNFVVIPSDYADRDFGTAADAHFHASRAEDDPADFRPIFATGRPIVLFEGTTFLDDASWRTAAAQNGTRVMRVPFGDLLHATTALAHAATAPRDSVQPQTRRKDPVGGVLLRLSRHLMGALDSDTTFVAGGGVYDVPVTQPAGEHHAPARRRERDLAWSHARRFVWRSPAQALETSARLASAELASHIDVEEHEICTVDAAPQPYKVHLHAFYIEELANDLRQHRLFRNADRLIITTFGERRRDLAHRYLSELGLNGEVRLCPNQGRDILPFLRLVRDESDGPDDLWVHLHEKRSVALQGGGQQWKNYLFRGIAGDRAHLSVASEIIARPDVGLVSVFDPYALGFGPSRSAIPTLKPEARATLPDHPGIFPVGNMFWTRARVVEKMWSYFRPDYPWPNEPIPNDGTVYHLIERLWQIAAMQCGLRSVFLDQPDQRRL